ncbi:MAG: VRR-NUC domain-containing protein [Bacteroidales bacterium]|jgi:hypothetical protein|nr:VRR-NUC domain-containing protein [Bacteroidales bacterium]
MRQLESKLQQSCVKWFRLQYPKLVLFAVPNGGSRNVLEAAKMKREGVMAGVADLILLKQNANYGALCIEMKYGGGRQSDHQKQFEKYCHRYGYQYAVCRTFDEFRDTVECYINE